MCHFQAKAFKKQVWSPCSPSPFGWMQTTQGLEILNLGSTGLQRGCRQNSEVWDLDGKEMTSLFSLTSDTSHFLPLGTEGANHGESIIGHSAASRNDSCSPATLQLPDHKMSRISSAFQPQHLREHLRELPSLLFLLC